MKTLFISLIVILAMNACRYDANGADPSDLKGTAWVLEDLAGLGVVSRAESTLVIGEDNRISGYGGCNRWFSSYTLEQGRLSIQPIAATKRLCPPDLMDQEKRFFEALTRIRKVEKDRNGRLLIYSEAYQQPLVFRPKHEK